MVLQENTRATFALDWAELWEEFGGFYVERVSGPRTATAEDFEDELLFCLLGGHGVTFELAQSAVAILKRLDVFDSRWSTMELEMLLSSELVMPQFSPPRRDGSLRRYRYPRRKASLIARAAAWVASRSPLRETVLALDEDEARRDFLCECPGIGLKTASWLLRNLGLGSSLAVVDIHLLRALMAANRISKAVLPRDYRQVEQRFLAWCKELKAPPAAFDLMLWEWQRAL